MTASKSPRAWIGSGANGEEKVKQRDNTSNNKNNRTVDDAKIIISIIILIMIIIPFPLGQWELKKLNLKKFMNRFTKEVGQ